MGEPADAVVVMVVEPKRRNSEVNRGLLSSGIMASYIVFLCWSAIRRWSIDVGWASTWVKIVNEWFAATVYLWKLISPVVTQTKVMNDEEPVQEADTTI
ncbi:hypothetical protein Vadar_033761 [Vaccinium darrowii]|uniref:Uncharacterized protein n=1 Tax=Vaccinium darrowii TaxID=229202 RepID=A0ACB7X6D1_9ERIC|nr:hypothetical protein Vadar_033761 [Vaccinium darrowii]